MQWPVRFIADVYISPAVENKLRQKYNLTGREVREAVMLCKVRRSFLEMHPERGERLLLTATTVTGTVLDVVLYPAGPDDDGLWSLGTAIPKR